MMPRLGDLRADGVGLVVGAWQNFGHMLPKLQKLHVSHNKLVDLPASLGLVETLRELWMSHNKVCGALATQTMSCLDLHLTCIGVQLTRLPDSVDHLTQLVSLRANR